MPEAAPDPASPMKCPEPMFEANREAPTWNMQELEFLNMILSDMLLP